MKKKFVAVVIALVAAQLLSGCYILRELSWSKDKLKPGDTTTATIGLQPSGGKDSEARFFLAVRGKGGGFEFKRPVFDSTNVTGQKEKLVEDPDITALLEEECNLGSVLRGPAPAVAWRTEDDVTADTHKFVEAKLKAKADGGDAGGGFGGIVASGRWEDDGDGVAEDPDASDDEVSCTGQSTTTFVIKGTAP